MHFKLNQFVMILSLPLTEPPSRVLNTKVDRNNENEIVLKWDLPKDDGMKVDGTEVIGELKYEVKYCPQQKVGCHPSLKLKQSMIQDILSDPVL